MLSSFVRTDLLSTDPSPPPSSGQGEGEPKTIKPSSEKEVSSFKKFFDKSCQDNEKSEDSFVESSKQTFQKQDDVRDKKEDLILPNFSFFPNFFFTAFRQENAFQVGTPLKENLNAKGSLVESLFQKSNFSLLRDGLPQFEKTENIADMLDLPLFQTSNQQLFPLLNEGAQVESNHTEIFAFEKNISLNEKNSIFSINSLKESITSIKNTNEIKDLNDKVEDYFPKSRVNFFNLENSSSLSGDKNSFVIITNRKENEVIQTKNNIPVENKVDIFSSSKTDVYIKGKTEEFSLFNLVDTGSNIKENENNNLSRNFSEKNNLFYEVYENNTESVPEKLNGLNVFINKKDKDGIYNLADNINNSTNKNIPVITFSDDKVKQIPIQYDIEEVVTIQSIPQGETSKVKDANSPISNEVVVVKNDESTPIILSKEKEASKVQKPDKLSIETFDITKKDFGLSLKENKEILTEKPKIEISKENNFKRNESSMQMSQSDNAFKKEEKFGEDKKLFDDKAFTVDKAISNQAGNSIVVSEKNKSDFSDPIVTTAIRKAIDLSSQLQIRGGGSAKIQIQDDKMGLIELNIHMKKDNTVTMEIKTSSKELKNIIESNSDSLKKSLDVQNITLTDFKVSTLDKSNQTNLNSGGGFFSQHQSSHNSEQNSQNQNTSQGFSNSFSNQGNSQFFQNSENDLILNPLLNPSIAAKSDSFKKVEKNSLANIRRGANGSIKVLA